MSSSLGSAANALMKQIQKVVKAADDMYSQVNNLTR